MRRGGSLLRALTLYIVAAVIVASSSGIQASAGRSPLTRSSSVSASGSGDSEAGAYEYRFDVASQANDSSPNGILSQSASGSAVGISDREHNETITFESLLIKDIGSRDADTPFLATRRNDSSSFTMERNGNTSSIADPDNEAITFESLSLEKTNTAPKLHDVESNGTVTVTASITTNASSVDGQRLPIEAVALSANATTTGPAPIARISTSSSASSSSRDGTPVVGGVETDAHTERVVEIHGVPSPPTLVTAAAFDSSAVVTWHEPDDDGSDPIVQYEVAWIDAIDGKVAGTKVVVASPARNSVVNSTEDANELVPTTATIASLINGRSYAFKVRAKNINGVSTWSAKSLAVSPLHPPDLCGRVSCSGHGTCFPRYEPDSATIDRTLAESAETASGHCVCRPGFNPPDCSVSTTTTSGDSGPFVWKVTEWSQCDNGCGGGQRTREATCWDVALDQQATTEALCADAQKPLLTRVCNGMECGSKLVTVRYQVETSFDEVLFSPESRDAFELAFTTEVAAALQVPRTRLEITAVKRGSIVVFFQILPASRVGERSLSNLWELLQSQLGNASSTLRSRGTFARRVETTGVKLSYSIADQTVAGGAGDISIAGLIGTVVVLCSFVALFGLFLRKRHEKLMRHTSRALAKESAAGQNVLHAKRSEMKPMGIRTMA